MTALQEIVEQPLTPDSLVPIMLKSADGWDQVAAFVALTMHPQDGDSVGAAEAAHSRHYPVPNARPRNPPMFAISNTATEEEEDDPGWSHSYTFTCSQDTS